jgi:hypothetical protein
MRTVSFQGTALSSNQRARVAAQKPYATVDWDSLRETLKSREFVGPKAPVVIPDEVKDDWYWKLAANFKRYGYIEIQQSGTPFVGSAFGYERELTTC